MSPTVLPLLQNLELGTDGIYSTHIAASDQADEIRLRSTVADQQRRDVLETVGRHHSIPVMDREVRMFLDSIPVGGVIADIGGGWGWHWRNIAAVRPDVSVIIVDFVRPNLERAKEFLGRSGARSVYLLHGDATALPFADRSFDGYWSVQTLQHVPDFERCIAEADRVLRPGGAFANYSLNRARFYELVHRLLGRPYHVTGTIPGVYHLARASREQAEIVSRIFGRPVTDRYTEVLLRPGSSWARGAREAWLARLDAQLSSDAPVFSWLARQRSIHVRKAELG